MEIRTWSEGGSNARGIRLVVGLALVFFAGPTAAQEVEGYIMGPAVALPDSLREYREGFSIRVVRSWGDDLERSLLRKAERLLPEAWVIEAAVERRLRAYDGMALSNWSERFEEARQFEGPRWWWLDEGWARLPFALTGGAVDHLVGAMRELSRSAPPLAGGNEQAGHEGSFHYEASVLGAAQGGYVVELEAQWTYHCGSRCGFGFTVVRRVTFDEMGMLVAIEGDGPPNWWVS